MKLDNYSQNWTWDRIRGSKLRKEFTYLVHISTHPPKKNTGPMTQEAKQKKCDSKSVLRVF